MINKILLILFILAFTKVNAQEEIETYKYEIDIGHDNDFLVLYSDTDRYYTYGINAAFKWKGKDEKSFFSKNERYVSHYNEIGLNIEAYTPDYLPDGSVDPSEERPYAGWSYLNLTQATAFSNSFLRLGADVGILGPDSQAGAIQNWFHREISGDPELKGWGIKQIPNELGVNLKAQYGINVVMSGLFNLYGTFDASVGNIGIYGRPMANIRFGKFAPIQYSVAHDNQLLAPKKQSEIYFATGLGAEVSAYNATVQGNIFKNEDPFSQKDINNLIFNAYFGVSFLRNRTSVQLKYHLTTGELISSEANRYATLSIAQRF